MISWFHFTWQYISKNCEIKLPGLQSSHSNGQLVNVQDSEITFIHSFLNKNIFMMNTFLGKFLKDGANILAKPISDLLDCQIPKSKPLFNKGSTTLLKNYH